MTLAGKKLILGVTGGISAYKTADLVSGLVQKGLSINVIMTKSATSLVGEKTFEALTGNKVYTSLWEKDSSPLAHIQLTREAHLFAVIPATANIIAKYSAGIADDLLTTALLAYSGKVLVAPAMNTRMLRHPATQVNLRTLAERGVELVLPASGHLACGEEGEGRLAPLEEIEFRIEQLLETRKELAGLTALVTAGGTREYLDAVRFIGNPATGKMGYALARALVLRGAKVLLISANSQLPPPCGAELLPVVSAQEMAQAVFQHSDTAQIVVMSSAVSDYIPKEVIKNKRKKDGGSWKIELSPALDILAELGKRKTTDQLLVGFSAETEELQENARKKLSAKNLDLICANPINEPGVGFASSENRLLLLDSLGKQLDIPRMSKEMAAELIVDKIIELLEKKGLITPGSKEV